MSSDVTGPVPEGKDPEEYDKLRRRILWTMPSGLYVIGSRSDDRRNGMTLNWITQLGFEPKQIGISVEKTALTNELIRDGHAFSVNMISRDDRDMVRKFTKPVTVEGSQMNGYPFHDGVTGAPILDDALAYLDCRVSSNVDMGDHTFFVGEVMDADFQKPEDTPVLRMEDTRMNYGG